jgi:hypothetical protein
MLEQIANMLAFELQSRHWKVIANIAVTTMLFSGGTEKTEMDSNYMFLCGVMWCKFGQQEAGKELLRAAKSEDPDMSALAWAMLVKGAHRLKDRRRAQTTAGTAL